MRNLGCRDSCSSGWHECAKNIIWLWVEQITVSLPFRVSWAVVVGMLVTEIGSPYPLSAGSSFTATFFVLSVDRELILPLLNARTMEKFAKLRFRSLEPDETVLDLPETAAPILRIEVEKGAALRMRMAHRRLVLRIIVIADPPAVRRFLFHAGVCEASRHGEMEWK